MRIVLIATALGSAALPAAAQTAVASAEAGRPAASCGTERIESVIVTGPTGERSPALDVVATEVNYWFRPEATPYARNGSIAVSLARSGVTITPRSASGDANFDRAARQAVDAAAHGRAFDGLAPADGAPPRTVVVHFGEDPSGRQHKLTERAICDAAALPTNPRPVFPLEFQPVARSVGNQFVAQTKQLTHGEVVARFLVDSLGLVDAKSVVVVRSTDPLFTRETLQVLPKLRYFPARIAGRASPQLLEQTFEFRAR